MSKDEKNEISEVKEAASLVETSEEMENGKVGTPEKKDEKVQLKDKPGKDKKEKTKKKSQKSKDAERSKELDTITLEMEKFRDKYLRQVAEFDNFRKRKEKEVLDSWGLAKADLIKKFIPTLDDLDRTLDAAKVDENTDALVSGLELVKKAFLKVLEDENVEVIDAVGKEFDPEIHEALLQMEKDGVDSNIVVEETQKGYKLGDRVLRPAKVIVSK